MWSDLLTDCTDNLLTFVSFRQVQKQCGSSSYRLIKNPKWILLSLKNNSGIVVAQINATEGQVLNKNWIKIAKLILNKEKIYQNFNLLYFGFYPTHPIKCIYFIVVLVKSGPLYLFVF